METLLILSRVSLGMFGVFFALAAFLFFFLHIGSVLAELTGRLAKKEITEMLHPNPTREDEELCIQWEIFRAQGKERIPMR